MINELPEASTIKLIATDLDGTLLNQEGKISKKTETVIKKVLEKYPDLHFVIVTGRTRPATASIRETLGITNRPNTESLNSNGCVVFDSVGNVTCQNTLPNEYILKFHKLLNSYPKAVYAYTYSDHLITFDEKLAKKAHEMIQENFIVGNKEEHIKTVISDEARINKVCFFSVGPDSEEIKKELEKLGKEYNLEYAHYGQFAIEYMPKNTNKGTGMTKLIKELNIKKEEVIAFGDGGNDLEFLQSVGWPVAMENCYPQLKQYAKIFAKSNKEDGVADILERIFLKEDLTN
ncbi:hypothetical protein BCR32DRAFT_232064 [Anaeromyces robustus]|uniref:HAD-like protein n=1 Tax=Anaeromyces robustus TaxID=1754192 RepID=A0A1Y1X948_9FUNG|nr:hypothetical protein BCR32DRAFT_232064 [Anaeromyces robustus]|eukprot:ORX82267.1 hypothetical protein BCR32DRAFT_232064 [Anaeromyces robustus]